MTNSEIKKYVSQLEGLSTHEIEQIVSGELALAAGSGWLGIAIGAGAFCGNLSRWTPDKVMDVCKKSIANASQSIRQILQNNPKTTNYSLEIIQLVAPAIAQQYGGISSMAIVGTLSILCKQGITNYIS